MQETAKFRTEGIKETGEAFSLKDLIFLKIDNKVKN